MQKLYKMKKPEAASVQKAVGDYLLKIDNVNGNTPSSISPTNSVGSQGSGSNTPPCQALPQSVHLAWKKQYEFFNYLSNCHNFWDQADEMVFKYNCTDSFIREA
uniref:Uncharacterized protein n=1 Tax=Megaselia scalaris TaxID=36166 RepID=T1GBD3_MEGSC